MAPWAKPDASVIPTADAVSARPRTATDRHPAAWTTHRCPATRTPHGRCSTRAASGNAAARTAHRNAAARTAARLGQLHIGAGSSGVKRLRVDRHGARSSMVACYQEHDSDCERDCPKTSPRHLRLLRKASAQAPPRQCARDCAVPQVRGNKNAQLKTPLARENEAHEYGRRALLAGNETKGRARVLIRRGNRREPRCRYPTINTCR
jgi:hypothetical protein